MKKLAILIVALVTAAPTWANNVRVVSPMPCTRVSSSAYEASRVLKTTPGTLMSLIGYNSSASAQFIQIFDSATVPADTSVPIMTFTVPAASNFSLDLPGTGIPCVTGIAVSNSSTGPTKTIGAADCWFMAIVQ